MSEVIISNRTCTDPITLIGEMAGICYHAKIDDKEKNYKRGLDCLNSQHGRPTEFPDVYMVFDDYSARVMREYYTHIGGSPTRLQESTRYIEYGNFGYIIPETFNQEQIDIYERAMHQISEGYKDLIATGVAKEDAAYLLPLGMKSDVVCKINLRTLMDMSHQRMCNRAHWEFRKLFNNIIKSLSDYSDEWKYVTEHYFMPKCKYLGRCPETRPCSTGYKAK